MTIGIGKVGKDSAAARFASATPSSDFSIQDDKPYAEVRLFPSMLGQRLTGDYSCGWELTHQILPKM